MPKKIIKDDDGFTPGERLDMAIAKDEPVLFFTSSEREKDMSIFYICNHKPKAFIGRFAHMTDVDKELPPVVEDMRNIVYGYDELVEHGGPREHAKQIDTDNDDEIEREIALMADVMRDKNEKSFGFFFLGEPTNYGGRLASGFKGRHSDIVNGLRNWWRQRPAHFIEFMRHLTNVTDDAKRKVVEQGDMGEMIKTITSELMERLDKHFNVEDDDSTKD